MGSSEELLDRWRSGDESAADELYRLYAVRLCRLAEKQLDRKIARRVDADDVVQSVFRTFFRRVKRGEYPLEDSGSLWSLLAQITLNKVRRNGERHRAAKRDIGVEKHPDGDSTVLEWMSRDCFRRCEFAPLNDVSTGRGNPGGTEARRRMANSTRQKSTN